MISISYDSNKSNNGESASILFARIPKWIIQSEGKLSASAVFTYAAIMSYADNHTFEAHPSRETLAADMGVSVPTVTRAVQQLRKFGALKIAKMQHKSKSGNYSSNRYTLAYERPFDTESTEVHPKQQPQITSDPRRQITHDPPPQITDDPQTTSTLPIYSYDPDSPPPF